MAVFVDTTFMDGYSGGPHITEVQMGLANQAQYGPDDYVLEGGKEAQAQVLTNNSIRIFDAVFVIQGRRDVIAANDYEDVSIDNGVQGMNRNDIIVRRYMKDESSEVESTSYAVIKGTPASGTATDPEVLVGDIRSGATLHNMKLYRVKIEGLNIVSVEPLFKVLYNMDTVKNMLTELNGKLGTLELLGENSSTSYKTFSGLDLSKFRYFILICGVGGSVRKANASTIIPAEFRHYKGASVIHEASFAKEPSNYSATMYFASESAIAIKSSSVYDCAWLYGVL